MLKIMKMFPEEVNNYEEFILPQIAWPDWKNNSDQTYSCPGGCRLSAIMCAQLRIIKTFRTIPTLSYCGVKLRDHQLGPLNDSI